jgi:DNA ligase-1
MRGEEVLPFAELEKRLGRREADLFMREEIPVRFVAFDVLWVAGQTLLDQPLSARRATLESLSPWPALFDLARITPAGSAAEIDAAFAAARARKCEGLMVKHPQSPYTPGCRGLAWLKLKKALTSLDCVVIGAEYGRGKRANVLSDYTFAVRDERTGELRAIGKVCGGLADQEIQQLTAHFLSTTVRQRGRYFEVPPDTVMEIAFDKVQTSDRHNSGLALRFPRIVRLRADKTVSDIDTVQTARKLVPKP